MRDRTITHKIIVIGASAGGVEALTRVVRALPPDLPAAVFVTMHFPAYGKSMLPQILNRCRTLNALHPQDGDPIELGRIYVSPPDYHLVVHLQQIYLSRGPRENGHRPAIDVLFRSAARSYGQQVIGVVLSGMLDDGTAGLKAIKERGGIAIVQDPDEASFSAMPRSAISNVQVDAVLKLTDLAARLVSLSQEPIDESTIEESHSMSDNLEQEADAVAQSKAELEQGEHPETTPSMVTCPDCGGVLWEVRTNGLLRYRCHVGHAYSGDSLLEGQMDTVELALWSSVRALEEKAALARRMAKHAQEQGRLLSEDQFLGRAKEATRQADVVRQLIAQQSEKSQPNVSSMSSQDGNG